MNPIEIIFRGKDETKAATESVKSGIDSIVDKSTEMNESLSQMNVILGSQEMRAFKDAAVDAFKAAGDAAMEFVNAAADAELVGVRMEATIRALGDKAPVTANEINELADELSKLTGFDDEELVNAQATLARIGSVSEENFERATRAAVDLAAATGMDLNSAFQSVGVAMENADFGRLARQIGDLPPEMQEAAKAALEMGDSLKAQDIILTGLEQKVGGVGEEIGETFTGQMNKLRTEYGNFQESVGTPLLKLFTELPEPIKSAGFAIYALGGTFGPVVSSVADLAIATRGLNAAIGGQGLLGLLGQVKVLGATSFLPMIASLGAVALAVGAVIVVWDQWNKQIVKTNEEGAKAIQSTWEKFFSDLETGGKSAEEILAEYRAAQERTNQVMEETNPIVRAFVFNKKDLVEADEELRASLLRVTGSQEEVNRLMAESGSVATQAAQEIKTAGVDFSDVFSQMAESFRSFRELPFLFEDGSGQLQIFLQALGIGEERAQNFGSALWAVVSPASNLPLIFEDGSGALQLLLMQFGFTEEGAQSFAQRIYDVVAGVKDRFEQLKSFFSTLPDWFRSTGENIVKGLWEGIQSAWTWLTTNLQNALNNLLAWVQNAISAHSPSKLWAEKIGKPMAEGIGMGFEKGMQNIQPSMSLSLQPAFSTANSAPPQRGGGTVINGQFSFYSPLTHDERRKLRRDQTETAQREMLRMLK